MIILDACDEMLDMGFREDIEFVLKTPDQSRCFVFWQQVPIILVNSKTKQSEMLKVTYQNLQFQYVIYFKVREQMK